MSAQKTSALAFKDLLALALELPPEERMQLAEALWESLDGVDEPAADDTDENVERAWLTEVGNRLSSLDDGTAVLIDADTHVARMRRFGFY